MQGQLLIGKYQIVKSREKVNTIIGLIIGYAGIILFPRMVGNILNPEAAEMKIVLHFVTHVLLCFGLLYHVKYVEKRTWSGIGFIPFEPERDLKWGLIGFVLGGMSFAITGPLVEYLGMSSTAEGIIRLAQYPIWIRVGISLVAGTTEEILIRTYPIERLREWTGSIWHGAIISVVLFGALHLPFWSLGGGIQIGIGTIIWTLIYIKTRSIWTMMIMHVANDLFAFVLLPIIFSL